MRVVIGRYAEYVKSSSPASIIIMCTPSLICYYSSTNPQLNLYTSCESVHRLGIRLTRANTRATRARVGLALRLGLWVRAKARCRTKAIRG